jgi:hypothetical protein
MTRQGIMMNSDLDIKIEAFYADMNPITWWLSPYRDENYNWKQGYRKLTIHKVSEKEKKRYLNKQLSYGKSNLSS